MRAVAEWLGVSFRPSMLESTWGGLHWRGDRLSTQSLKPAGWSPGRNDNNWRNRLGAIDQYVLNFLMFDRLRNYDYPCRAPRWWDCLVVPFLLCLPMKYERRFFGPRYVLGRMRRLSLRGALVLASTPWFYLRRITLFFRYYLRALNGRPFEGPWIGAEGLGE